MKPQPILTNPCLKFFLLLVLQTLLCKIEAKMLTLPLKSQVIPSGYPPRPPNKLRFHHNVSLTVPSLLEHLHRMFLWLLTQEVNFHGFTAETPPYPTRFSTRIFLLLIYPFRVHRLLARPGPEISLYPLLVTQITSATLLFHMLMLLPRKEILLLIYSGLEDPLTRKLYLGA